jgi:hypothetical protein
MVAKSQGQILWANLPDPLGWRPILILTRDDALPKRVYAVFLWRNVSAAFTWANGLTQAGVRA